MSTFAQPTKIRTTWLSLILCSCRIVRFCIREAGSCMCCMQAPGVDMIERAVGCATALNDCYRSCRCDSRALKHGELLSSRRSTGCNVSLRCAGRSFLSPSETA
jgi:hypothetical protein